jgi:hypothetical protein
VCPDLGRFAAPQGEPEFKRLKQELDEAKSEKRAVEGNFRSQADYERHKEALIQQVHEEQVRWRHLLIILFLGGLSSSCMCDIFQ